MWEITPVKNIKQEKDEDEWNKSFVTDESASDITVIKEELSNVSCLVPQVKMEVMTCKESHSQCMESQSVHCDTMEPRTQEEESLEELIQKILNLNDNLYGDTEVMIISEEFKGWNREFKVPCTSEKFKETPKSSSDLKDTSQTLPFLDHTESSSNDESPREHQKSISSKVTESFNQNSSFPDGWSENVNNLGEIKEWLQRLINILVSIEDSTRTLNGLKETNTVEDIIQCNLSQPKESSVLALNTNTVHCICCKCKAISKDNMNAVNISQSGSTANKFHCRTCDYTCSFSEDLNKHMHIHVDYDIAKINIEFLMEQVMKFTQQISKNIHSLYIVYNKANQLEAVTQNNNILQKRMKNLNRGKSRLKTFNIIETHKLDKKIKVHGNKKAISGSLFKSKMERTSSDINNKNRSNKDDMRSDNNSSREINKKLGFNPVVLLDVISPAVKLNYNLISNKSTQTEDLDTVNKIINSSDYQETISSGEISLDKNSDCLNKNEQHTYKYKSHNESCTVEGRKVGYDDNKLEKSKIDKLSKTKVGKISGHEGQIRFLEENSVIKKLQGINGVCDIEAIKKQKLTFSSLQKYKCPLCSFKSASLECVRTHKNIHFCKKNMKLKKSETKRKYRITCKKVKQTNLISEENVENCKHSTQKKSNIVENADTDKIWEENPQKSKKQQEFDVLGTGDKIKPATCTENNTHEKISSNYKISKLDTEKKTLHKCALCNFRSLSHEVLIQHGRVHNNNTKVKQVNDSLHIGSVCEFKDNKTDKQNQFKYKCSICTSEFKNIQSYENHKKKHRKVYECNKCDYTCTAVSSLKFHEYIHSGEKPYKCKFCPYSCRRPDNLLPHLRLHLGEKRYKCTVCLERFTQSSSLTAHMRTHTGQKPYACELCDYKCSRLSNLKFHMDKHSGIKPYKCNTCGNAFARLHSLKVHMRSHTGEKPYKCTLCNYSGSMPACLRQHMFVHTRERHLKCSFCPYATHNSVALTVHIRTHTGEKPFKCEYCDYRSSRSFSIKVHTRIHTGEKPYVCSICEYACSSYGNLQTHIRTHTGEKPFACSSCPVKFTTRSALVLHTRIHTGERPFKCTICEYRSFSSTELKKHVKRRHEKDASKSIKS